MSSDSPAQEKLFEDFKASTYEEWKEAAVASLKGAPFEKRVITRTYENIDLQPIYGEADLEGLTHLGALPGFPPYVRGVKAEGYLIKPWGICQELSDSKPEDFNQAAQYDLDRGQTELGLALDPPTRRGLDPAQAEEGSVGRRGLSLADLTDLETALAGIDLEKVPVMVSAGASALPLAALFIALAQKRGQGCQTLSGCLGADPLGELAATGRLDFSLDRAYDLMTALAGWAGEHSPELRTVLVKGSPYHDAGAAATQELGYVLATGVEYLRALIERGLDVNLAARAFKFSFSLGGHFFMEIAKLRAARLLWNRIVEAFGGDEDACKMSMHARTSSWTKSARDPYVNMLRNTTEAFSGVAAGVDSLHVAPFDEPVRPPDEFSRRVSRNLQLLLKHECRFTQPIDPAGGAWFIEVLTDQVAQKAWEIFQEIEAAGGMAKALETGLPQKAVQAVADKRAQNLNTRKDVLVGINMYPNLMEKTLAPDETDYQKLQADRIGQVEQRLKANPGAADKVAALAQAGSGISGGLAAQAAEAALAGATIGMISQVLASRDAGPSVNPMNIHRAAQQYETLRDNAARLEAEIGRRIKVFLANMGPIPQHKARADFTTAFFEVGGFQVLTNNGFPTADEAAEAAIGSGAEIIAICSTDPTYPEIVPPLARKIKEADPNRTIILAGKPAPEYADEYTAAGLDDAVHLRADCYGILAKLQKKYGVPHE